MPALRSDRGEAAVVMVGNLPRRRMLESLFWRGIDDSEVLHSCDDAFE